MGGANAPNSVIEAISIFLTRRDDVFFEIYGIKSLILPKIIEYNIEKDSYKLLDCPTTISDEDKPLDAWRKGKDSSMKKSIDAVKNGSAHAAVSSGNTGALMLMSKMILDTLEEVKRPAIAGIFPCLKNEKAVILDMGANIECDYVNLFHFALMGSCFAKTLLNKKNPRIGILNIGTESTKGRELEQKTYEILEKSGLNFIGFIEAHEIVEGKADVVVTDGFCGNIFLKSSEGTANACVQLVKESISNGNWFIKLCAKPIKPYLQKAFEVIDPNKNNGAMFIGLNGVVVKSHGSSITEGVVNAIEKAYQLHKNDINKKILEEIHNFEEVGIGLNFVDKIKKTSAKILGMN